MRVKYLWAVFDESNGNAFDDYAFVYATKQAAWNKYMRHQRSRKLSDLSKPRQVKDYAFYSVYQIIPDCVDPHYHRRRGRK